MNAHELRLGWRTLWRDWRSGDLRLLTVAIMLAVAALSSVGFFADRLQAGLERDARQLLGGDVVLVSDQPTPPVFVERARTLGLEMVTSLSFPTMARASEAQGGSTKLVALKSVQGGYPLRGQLQLALSPTAQAYASRSIPAPGHVWVDAPVLDALNLAVGDTLMLGDASLTIDRVIVIEPDRGAGFLSFAPRVMMNEADMPATALVQPASRLTYRFALAGPDAAVKTYTEWAQAQLGKQQTHGVRLESLESGRPEMRQTLDRAQKFLSLVALLAALLSAVAVALAARGFAVSHLDAAAMLRVLGQSQRTIATSYIVEFVLVGLLASACGLAIGYATHHVFIWLLSGLVSASLPSPTWWPVALGMGMGLTLMLAFGVPPVLQLAQVPALRVMRRDMGAVRPASAMVLGVGLLGFAALLLVVSQDLRLGLMAVGGFAAAAVLFAGLAWLAVRVLRALVNDASAPSWLVLATRQIAARPAYAVVQVSSLAVGLLALVLLVLLRTDLISSWQQATPPDAPNRFVINIMPDQGEAFQEKLRQADVQRYDWYPMIRGRLVAINGRTVSPDDYKQDDRAQRLVDREFNLSHAQERPEHNPISAGVWTPGEEGAVSVEDGIAETLGLKMGDTLRFDIGGVVQESRITSFRKVDWGSLRANFFVMYPVARMGDIPVTYLAAYRAPLTPGFDNALVQQFPNITNVNMSATLAQVQGVLGQVIRAVEFLFAFTLAAGMVVLFAAVTATREERAHEYAIMRAVGARSRLLRQVQRAELAGVGMLAGFLASAVAMAVGWGLAKYVFNFAWTAAWWVPLAGALVGACLAMAAGWWGLRDVLRRPVVETLRRAG